MVYKEKAEKIQEMFAAIAAEVQEVLYKHALAMGKYGLRGDISGNVKVVIRDKENYNIVDAEVKQEFLLTDFRNSDFRN